MAYFEVTGGALGCVVLPPITTETYDYYEDHLEFTLDELRAMQSDLSRAESLWEITAGIIPEAYLQRIAYFEVFTDGIDDMYGSILEIGDSGDTFILSLDLSDMYTAEGELIPITAVETIIHELGHIITLGQDQVARVDEDEANPATYYIYEYDLDTTEDSYLNRFFHLFWQDLYEEWSAFYYLYGIVYVGEEEATEKNEEILLAYLDKFYAGYADRFVTDYAATSPAEDIAESFMVFVLEDKPTGGQIGDEKILFFYDYPELLAVRTHIREYLLSAGLLGF